MTYPEALRSLESLVNYEKAGTYPYRESLKLERMKAFLSRLGDPQEAFHCIHVAGSKGKGSTCAYTAFILRRAGFRTALYTSPHLADFRERIRVLEPFATAGMPEPLRVEEFEGAISQDDLERIAGQLMPEIEDFAKESAWGPPTFFEAATALAFLHFRSRGVDYAVIETGLGGRLDATNAVCPLVCALTPISYEHTDKLGPTLADIAGEKSGIIKVCAAGGGIRYPVVVSAAQDGEAQRVIRARCEETGARLYEVGRDILPDASPEAFGIRGAFKHYDGLRTRLPGAHQRRNAALAVGAVEALRHYGVSVPVECVRAGIADTVWPGRCEVLSREPLVIIDGAQNIASMRALKDALRSEFRYDKLILVIGISQDKDIRGICEEIRPCADVAVVTRAATPRAAPTGDIAVWFEGVETIETDSVAQARETARARAGRDDAVLVCGSLFVVGEFKYGRC